MRAVQRHFGIWLLLVSGAAAQSSTQTAAVQNVTATREGADLRVEITLSAPVTPAVETAVHPDRILLDFPATSCGDRPQKVEVNRNGVQRVRTAQHSAAPLVTRVVLDLDRAHPYTLKAEGNRIILTVSPAENARRSVSQGAPVAATSGNLIGIFRRRQEAPAPVTEENFPASPPPPPPAVAAGPSPVPASNGSPVAALPP